MKGKITFYGIGKDIDLARKLCMLCEDDISALSNVTVLAPKAKNAGDTSKVVAEYGSELDAKCLVTYSVGQSAADICALNYQTRETSRSLELLSGSFMGRVNIPKKSEYTELSVLLCAAGLLASGAEMSEILKVINEKAGA